MDDSRSVIRVFIASPSDLGDERRAAKEICDEVNSNLANPFNLHVDLVGWEETITGFGRPQSLINKDLDRCDAFIGVLWKRWGSKPGPDSEYTSGFEEEYRRTLARRAKGEPVQIGMLLKGIDKELLKDPGEQLKCVLQFRSELNEKQEVYYEEFSDPAQFQNKFRRAIYKLVRENIQSLAVGGIDESENKSGTVSEGERGLGGSSNRVFPNEIADFLSGLIEREIDPEKFGSALSAVEIARLRLVGKCFTSAQNDADVIEPHDANIIFNNPPENLTHSEKYTLFASGIHNLNAENVPVFRWLNSIDNDGSYHPLFFHAHLSRSPESRSGAIKVMHWLGAEIDDSFLFERSEVYSSWFSGTADQVRSAALGYLAEFGRIEDLELIQEEVDRAAFATQSEAINALIALTYRASPNTAFDALMANDPSSPSSAVVDLVQGKAVDYSDDQVLQGLSAKSSSIRIIFVREAIRRDILDSQQVAAIKEDSDAAIRYLILTASEDIVAALTLDDAKRVLVRPRKPGLLFSQGDYDGERAFERFQISWGALQTRDTIQSIVEEAPFGRYEIFAGSASSTPEGRARIRADLRDSFESRFSEYMDSMGSGEKADDLRRRWAPLKTTAVNTAATHALTVLCSRDSPKDMALVREKISEFEIRYETEICEYIARHGTVSDIDLLIDIYERSGHGEGLLRLDEGRKTRAVVVTEAILRLCDRDLSKVPSSVRNTDLLPRIIHGISAASLQRSSEEEILNLLNSEKPDVRKAIALACVTSLTKTQIRTLLNRITGQDRWFYNSVVWLDLGASLNRQAAIATSKRVQRT